MCDNYSDLDGKYKDIYDGNFENSNLITHSEKKLIFILDHIALVMLVGFVILSLLANVTSISDGLIFFMFILIFGGSILGIVYLGRFVMKKCITLLGEEYFKYRELQNINEYRYVKDSKVAFEIWKKSLLESKFFKDRFCIKTKRYAFQYPKRVVIEFKYRLFVFFDKIDYSVLSSKNLSSKGINIVYCIKDIDINKDEEKYTELLEPGYTEKSIEGIIVRFGNIYFNKKTNEVIHRPRVVLYNLNDKFLKKFKYATKPSVIVDHSLVLSNYILTDLLKLDLD